MSSLSSTEALSLSALSLACFGVIANSFQGDGEPLIVSLAFSGFAFASTFSLIRWLGPVFLKAGLKGRDMSKVKGTEMYCSQSPEECRRADVGNADQSL